VLGFWALCHSLLTSYNNPLDDGLNNHSIKYSKYWDKIRILHIPSWSLQFHGNQPKPEMKSRASKTSKSIQTSYESSNHCLSLHHIWHNLCLSKVYPSQGRVAGKGPDPTISAFTATTDQHPEILLTVKKVDCSDWIPKYSDKMILKINFQEFWSVILNT